MNHKPIQFLSLVLLIPAIGGCVRVPAKAKPMEATKVIFVDASFVHPTTIQRPLPLAEV